MSNDFNFRVDETSCREFLSKEGWPRGLQETCILGCRKSPLRFVIVDDSGSMLMNDGHKLTVLGHSTMCVTK